ncbi:hypothetical protein V8D89_000013 [Ganoderma adspersum]
MSDLPPTDKRPRGHPKGTKNKPTAGKVGRPCKDRQPPHRRSCPGMDCGTETSLATLDDPASAMPDDAAPATPVNTAPATPVDTAPATPVDTAPATPIDTTTATLVNTTPTTPVNTTPATPVNAIPAILVNTASRLPDGYTLSNDGVDNPYGSDLCDAPWADEDEDEDLHGDEDMVEDDLEDKFQPPGDDEEDSSSLRAICARSTMPTWLENEYQLMCQKLRGEMGQGKAAATRSHSNGNPIYLQCAGWTSHSQRVVDVDRVVYLVGYRYKCGTCNSGYQSWSPAVMDILPRSVAVQFPFHLTHHGGLSDGLVALLCEYFREGVGPVPFTKLLRSLHYRRYDHLHVQYYEMARERMEGTAAKFLAKLTHFGEFSDCNRYAGYIPGHNYFTRFHDALMEDWAPELQQVISMASARILAIDHSFEVNKCMGKVKKTAIFSATHSTVNEYAHDQFMPLLAQIPATSAKYGHGPIEVIYTDNVKGDKRALEMSVPPLLHEIVPVGPAQSNLEPLTIPGKWSIILLNTALQVDLHLKSIMGNHAPDQPVEVALDMEWPVDLESGMQGRVAVIQIAYWHHVYLIQVNSFLHLPNSLLTFFRTLDADFKRLHKDCGFTSANPPFSGQLDLGAMAKDRGAATRHNTGLVQLVESVLRRQLVKDPEIQVSRRWANEDLHNDFQTYTALDAVASWLVYEQLQTMDVIEVITSTTPGGTPVTLIANDGQAVAHGVIALDCPAEFDHMKVTPSRSIVAVTEVLVKAYKLPVSLLPSRVSKPLSAFGPTPFRVLYHTHLLCPHHSTTSSAATPPSSLAPQLPVDTVPRYASASCSGCSTSAPLTKSFSETVPIGDHNESNLEAPDDKTTEQREDKAECDPQNQDAYNVTRSRVLGNIFHLHNQFPISKDHSLRRPFFQALSAALFVSDASDKAALETVLHRSGLSYSSKLISSPQWVLHRVCCYVPAPEVLLPYVTAVLKTFGPLKDAQTGLPLFNQAAWDVTKNVLENIRLGYYSDPPGVQLYYEVGEDHHGLKVYRCCRGTNSVEGGVHQSLIHRFTSFNVSARFAVGTKNRTRHAYIRHFDVPLKNCPSGRRQWINGNDYEPAGETFGIMLYNSEIQDKYHFLPFNSPMASELKYRNTYLAQRQGTRYAVLPVHTSKERSIFHSLVSTSASFKTRAQPDWHMLAVEWSGQANGRDIFYKLPEHLKSYFKIWTDISSEKSSVTLTAQAIQHLHTLVQSRNRGHPIKKKRTQEAAEKAACGSSESMAGAVAGFSNVSAR